MIRRGFWLTVGAAAGIMGYRRVSAAGRRLSGRLTGGGTHTVRGGTHTVRGGTHTVRGGTHTAGSGTHAAGSGTHAGRALTAAGLARETVRFTRDVREGMELYKARHREPPGRTLNTTDHDPRPKDGR